MSAYNKKKIKVAVLGPSGYTGSEVLRILLKHPYVEIDELVGDQTAGKSISEVFSHFHGLNLPTIKSYENSNLSKVDIVFSCAPSGVLAEKISSFPKHLSIIDLSSDFRFTDIFIYNKYYENHKNPEFVSNFSYGLSEIFKDEIKSNKFIACPGCYPTSSLLPLVPLFKNDLVFEDQVIIDSKSGITGAGRTLNQNLLFSENFASSKAYGDGNHRHKPEIQHILEKATNKKIEVTFTPHIIPINRGILSTIYIKGNYSKVKDCLKSYYEQSKFVKISKDGVVPKVSDVVGSNLCRIGIINNYESNWITIISVIDNLIKGASGQAVQNLNIFMNYPEELGLDNQSLSP